MDVVEELKKSQNKLLKTEGKDVSSLVKNLQHTVSDLRKLLKISILDIEIQNGKRYVCTANEELVKKFSPIRNAETSVSKVKQDPFETKNDNVALAWDLLHNKYITIVGNRWHVFNFMVVKSENSDMLHSLIIDILRKPL